jgi:hypothetical protein
MFDPRARNWFLFALTVLTMPGMYAGRAQADDRGLAPCFGFSSVGPARGLTGYLMTNGLTGGVNVIDYDNDGDLDIFAPTSYDTPLRLYENDGTGHFTDIAAQVGLGDTTPARASLWFDYDGDGDLDVVVGYDSYLNVFALPATTLRLFQQQTDGQFVDVTLSAQLFGNTIGGDLAHLAGLAAGDINNDGWLDLVQTCWHGLDRLYRNNGDGTFTDISVLSGITTAIDTAWQPLLHDFNDDGWLDLFVAIDFGPNMLWINRGDDTFINIAPAAQVDSAFNEMGVTLGDYDNDGDFDLYVTNIFDGFGRHNVMFRNVSSLESMRFSEVSDDFATQDSAWGWGTTFVDANLDGWLDLAATNGFARKDHLNDPSAFFLNPGDGAAFLNVSDAVNFNDEHWGSCIVAGDVDRDGDQDIVQTCNLDGPLDLHLNSAAGQCGGASYLVVKPRMTTGGNRFAIGSTVRATVGETRFARFITAGTSMAGQEPAEAFFGLADATLVDQVRIEWPDGRTTLLTDVAVNQVITVTDEQAHAPCTSDIDGNDAVDVLDFFLLLQHWGPCDPLPANCPWDIEPAAGNGVVDVFDFFALLQHWGACF